MASQEAIQKLLQAEYNSTRWKGFLSELFTSSTMYSNPIPLMGINAAIASQALHIGSIAINENGISRSIAVYEVTLAENVVLERNRVGLRNVLKPHWKEQDAAFIVYFHPQNKSWRFSYVSELKKFNEAGDYVANNTEPKRYTYVLGESESCRTAAERFYQLQQKANNATLDDVKEAFSVEKLSKTFFAEYKDHYQDFVQFLTGKRLEKVAGKWEDVVKHAPSTQLISIFNNNEKDVRDFCKKLLGRIVFLYFIQKKGWLGVPVTDNWGKGNYNYLSTLFKNCLNPSIFYSEYLSKLFFDTLNQQRDQDIIEIIPGEPCRIPYLNGGLFEEDNTTHRNLVFEANLFKHLFDFFDQYNFTIYEDDPNDHTVAVDPEMLGHIFENLLEDNKDKGAFYTPKEIVHYMCQESLIEYLTTWFEGQGYTVQQTSFISFDNATQTSFISANDGLTGQGMLEISESKSASSKLIDRSIIEKLLKKQLSDDDKQAVVQHADNFNAALDAVKICDPAIGSGAFPMGLLQEIFTAKQTIHTFTHSDLTSFEPATIKLNIIQNSIYGVDIERGAVDIARLRFWLSLVVDEPAPQALPNLDYKIVVGDSLISKLGNDVIEIDWDVKKHTTFDIFGEQETKSIQTILKQISSLQKDFFNPSALKKDHATKIRDLKIDLLIEQLNLMINSKGIATKPTGIGKNIAAQTELYLQTEGWKQQIKTLHVLKTQQDKPLEFFDWQLNFAEVMNKDVAENGKVGFDIVIGNPPYIRQEAFSDIKAYLKAKYNIYHSIADLLTYFVELSYNILANKGSFSFIISNKFTRANYGQTMRKFLLEKTSLTQLIDFSGIPVFENATVDAAILGFNKQALSKTDNQHQFAYLSVEKSHFNQTPLDELLSNQLKPYPQQQLTQDAWAFENAAVQVIKQKVEAQGVPLKEWDISISRGILTGFNEAFIIDAETKSRLIAEDPKSADVLKPLLRGRDIQKYQMEYAGLWLINLHNGYTKDNKKIAAIKVDDYPAIKVHLDRYYDKLKVRTDKGITPYNLRNCAFLEDIKKPKIIYPNMTKYMPFALDLSGQFYHNDKSFHLLTSRIYWLCAMLNSTLFDYCFRDNFPELLGGTRELRKVFFDKIPIKQITETVELPFKQLIEKIIKFKSESKETKHLEDQIDNMIYKLYALTIDEVKTINSEFNLSEAEYNSIEI
jgi:adenine-specific DNA-methyltransferase